MNKDEIIKSLNKVYENSKDSHNIYTPLELCEEMINSLSDLNDNKSILVISNLEFLIVLKSKISLENVHYTTSCDIKKQVAISLGLNVNNIYNLEYNKEISLGIEENMKFDYIIQNPPYNPNSLYTKFVEKSIDLLKNDGKMAIIHPDSWRISSKYDKLFNKLKNNISELHIMQYEIWKDQKVATSVDWYIYNNEKQEKIHIFYSKDDEILDTNNINRILRISTKSIPYSILKKITKKNYNNGCIFQGRTGYHPLYKKHDPINGIYKQCGTEGRGVTWTRNDFSLTIEPNDNQYLDKVVIAYANKPRAHFFSKDDKVGVVRAHYWLTNNKSLPILLNSKMFWKIACSVVDPDKDMYKPYGMMASIPSWLLNTLNFDNLNVQTEEELYRHYNLTQEEINWIEQ